MTPDRVEWRRLTRAELDLQLSPSRFAKDFPGILMRHEAETQASLVSRRTLRYGPRPRNEMDVTDGASDRPCFVFIHGGFWQEGSKAGSGFAVPAFAAVGWAHAALGYTLAPEARLEEIVDEIAAALDVLRGEAPDLGIDPDRIVLAGHSAGGHLAAAILSGMAGSAEGIAGALLISGVYDLAPVAASYVNDAMGMTEAEAEALSPLLRAPTRDIPVRFLIGADEPEAFQRQTDALAAAWRPHLSRVDVARVAGRDHFDILDELADPASDSFRAVMEMAK